MDQYGIYLTVVVAPPPISDFTETRLVVLEKKYADGQT
jgi:hypothetical protein